MRGCANGVVVHSGLLKPEVVTNSFARKDQGLHVMRVVRVFPRRTSMTPVDDLAFVGDPPLWRPRADEVHVSVCFTWDIEEGYRLQEAWSQYYDSVKIGGPAISGSRGEFVPGKYVKEGVTFTSRGCNRRCPWCLVPEWEGDLQLLDIKPGWIVNDNNLLMTPREHQKAVFDMLREQKRSVSFPGGLDTRLIDDWVAEQLKTLKISQVFLAADTEAALEPLERAVKKLSFLSRRQLRCYVLLAFNGETISEASRRLEAVWKIGCMPFAQLYQPPDRYIQYSHEWKALARTWSRPAAMFAMHRE